MPDIDCHGCEKPFPREHAKWIAPFESHAPGELGSIEGFRRAYDHPVDGGVPYCPTCVTKIIQADR